MKKDTIFELVQHLEKGERREFTNLYSRGKSTPDFLKLYRFILRSNVWSAEKAMQSLKVDSGRLYQLKNNLKEAIYSFLRYRTDSKQKRLADLLYIIDELVKRNQLSLAAKEIRRGKRIAKVLEDNEKYSQLNSIESILPPEYGTGDGNDWLETFNEEIGEYTRLQKLMSKSLEQKSTRGQKIELAREILNYPQLQTIPRFVKAQKIYWVIKINGFTFLQDWERAIEAIESYVDFVEANKEILPNPLNLILHQVKRLPILHTLEKDIWSRDKSILKIKMMQGETELERAGIFFAHSIPELSKWISSGLFEIGLEELDTFQTKFDSWEYFCNENSRTQFCFMAGYLCLFAGEFVASRKWMQRIINYPHSVSAVNLYLPFVYLGLAISFFHSGDADLAEKHLRSLNYHTRTKKLNYQYFQLFSNILMSLINQKDNSTSLEFAFSKALALKNDSFESRPFGYFDLTPWLKSLTTGQSISKIQKEEYSRFLEECRKKKGSKIIRLQNS